jgi:hypothetical protein
VQQTILILIGADILNLNQLPCATPHRRLNLRYLIFASIGGIRTTTHSLDNVLLRQPMLYDMEPAVIQIAKDS